MSNSPELGLRAYVDYLHDLGIHDLYRREEPSILLPELLRLSLLSKFDCATSVETAASQAASPAHRAIAAHPHEYSASSRDFERVTNGSPASSFSLESATPSASDFATAMPRPKSFDDLVPLPTFVIPPSERSDALDKVRKEIGDCVRCPLAFCGRHKIVFADGTPSARIMFIGEGPGADEDVQGLPFVGKAGQLLNNMIMAMGLKREEVYIANIVKCRPPGNRTPEYVEATMCSQFLIQQIDIVRPEVIVALGGTAATYLLGVKQSLSSLRGRWYSSRGAKVVVTYHPAFLLRDPRQKGEAWKDLQLVMSELGLKAPSRS